MTGCARNEFDDIIFRISCSRPHRKWTAQLAAAVLIRFCFRINGVETLGAILLNLRPFDRSLKDLLGPSKCKV